MTFVNAVAQETTGPFEFMDAHTVNITIVCTMMHMNAVINDSVCGVLSLNTYMIFDFFWNSSAVFAKKSCDSYKAKALIKAILDSTTIF